MAWNEQLPEWNAVGAEPTQTKKNEGWQPDERPPAGWFNWLLNRAHECLVEIRSKFDGHTEDTTNPHSVTKTHVELSNVDNVKQLGATEQAVDSAKLENNTLAQVRSGTTQTDVGLSNVDNMSATDIRTDGTKGFTVEVRTTDPTSPATGRMWLRSDL